MIQLHYKAMHNVKEVNPLKQGLKHVLISSGGLTT